MCSSFIRTCKGLYSKGLECFDTGLTPKTGGMTGKRGGLVAALVAAGSVEFMPAAQRLGRRRALAKGEGGVSQIGRGLDTNMGWVAKILYCKWAWPGRRRGRIAGSTPAHASIHGQN